MPQTVLPVYVKDKNGNVGSPITYTSTIFDNEGDPIGGFITQSEVAPEYGTKASYAVGEYCSVNNTVYKCTNAVPDSSVAFNPSDWTNTNAMDEMASVNTSLANIFNLVYPVGSIYMSTDSSNPSTKFGGTWVAWGSGRVPVGVDANDTAFDTVEETGGSKSQSYTPAGSNSGAAVTMNAVELSHSGTAVTMNAVELSHSGGAVKSHTLTTSEMPAHNHSLLWYHAGTGGGAKIPYGTTGTTFVGYDASSVQNTGGGGGHSHDFTQPSKHSFTPTTKSVTNPSKHSFTPTTKTVTNPTFTGTAETISHLQPYITCYMWKRTA